MGYYQGDYRGDPFWGALIGPAIAGISGLFKRRGPAPVRFPVSMPGGTPPIIQAPSPTGLARYGPMVSSMATRAGGLVAKHPVLSAAAAAGTIGLLGRMGHGAALGRGGAALMQPAMGGGMRGFHISRRTGATVRNRRMRVTNPKALHRAIRRATGFARLAKKVLRFTSPRAPRGRAVFKARRKKRV